MKKLQKKLKTAKKIQQLLADDPGLLQALALSGGGAGGGAGGSGGGSSKKPKKKSTPSIDGDDDLAENSNAKGMRESIKVTVRNDSPPPPSRGRRRSRSRTPPRRRRSREERGGGDRKRRRSPSPEGEILFHCCFGQNDAVGVGSNVK